MKFAPTIVDIRTNDYAAFSWSRLRRYRNINWLTDRLMNIHKVESKQKSNVQAQANQISLCIDQSEQYFKAAYDSGFMVKPLLAYYGAVALATALVMYLGDGNHRIQKLREKYGRHGLKLSVQQKEKISPLDQLYVKEDGVGLFQIFNQLISGDYTFGLTRQQEENGRLEKYEALLFEDGSAYSRSKLSFDVAKIVSIYPDFFWHCEKYNCYSALARINLSKIIYKDKSQAINLLVQPCSQYISEKIRNSLKFPAYKYDCIRVDDISTGFDLYYSDGDDKNLSLNFPTVYRDMKSQLYMNASTDPVRQVSLNYILLFVFGMYSRYYPEMWAADISSGSEVFLVAYDLMDMARHTFPLFILQEFEFEMYHN